MKGFAKEVKVQLKDETCIFYIQVEEVQHHLLEPITLTVQRGLLAQVGRVGLVGVGSLR